MQEIKEVLLRHDIAGVVILHTPGHSEELYHLTPGYSCATIEPTGGIRFKAKLAEFGGDVNKLVKKQADSANMMIHLSQRTGVIALNLMEISEKLDGATGAEHGPGTYTPQIDN